jgi:signal transduction histidine kinase
MIEANPDSVRQALLNLVDNAIKYSAVQPAIYFQHS